MRHRPESTYHILVPKIFRIVFPTFITCVIVDTLDLVFLLILGVRVSCIISTVFLVELFEVLDVVYIVWYTNTAT